MATKKILLSIAMIFFALICLNPASGLETKGVRDSAFFAGTISGSCFNDVNQNGKKDAGEAGVEGITVSLKRMVFFIFPMDAGAAAANADGSYEITGLQPGLYLVEVQNKSGAECTTKNPVQTWLGFFKNKKTADFGFMIPEKDITEFSILGVKGTIGANTLAVTLPYGTDRTALTPTITITGISISPASGLARDFTSPVTYTVTAADSTTKAYTVTVTVASSSSKDITEFSILGVEGGNCLIQSHTIKTWAQASILFPGR